MGKTIREDEAQLEAAPPIGNATSSVHASGNGSNASHAGLKEPASNDFHFKHLFANNPLAMYVYDADTLEILEVNESAITQYGYAKKEFEKLRLTDLRSPQEVNRPSASRASGNSGARRDGEWTHRCKNGREIIVELSTHPIDFGGRKAVLAVAQDVTSRKRAEEQSATHAAYLNALTENNPIAIVVLDTDDRIQMCNPAFEKLFQYSQEELLGQRVDALFAPEGLDREARELSRRVGAGSTVRATTQRRRRNGGLIDVQVIGVPLAVNGRQIGTFGMYEDITERRNAERAQKIAEDGLRSLFENAIEGIFQTTPEGRYLNANPALARIFGYASPAEMMNSVSDIGAELYADPGCRAEFISVMEKRDVVEGFEYELVRKDGARVWINENAHAVRDDAGKLLYYEGTVEDITARKRSETERQATLDIIHSVNVTNNLDDLLDSIHTALKKVFYAENCFVALFEPSSGMFHFPFFADQFDAAPPPQEVGRSCTAYVYSTGRAMLIPQPVFDKLAEQGEVELVGTPSPSWLGVPLRTPSATIGVLVVQHYEDPNAYTERDLEFLASVGGQIALAIERKRSETALRESEARLRVLIEQLPAILWTVDPNLRFASALGAGLTRLGLQPNTIVGKTMAEFFETSAHDFLPIAAHRRAIAGEPVTFHMEWRGGSYACHVEPLRDSSHQPHGAICMALDVSDRKKLEEQLRQAQKMEAVGRLAGGIAHDFNNLLMVVQGHAELLTDRLKPGEPLRRNAEQIQEASQRAASLTRQLLAFSRKQMLAPSVLNVQTVVTDMEKILRRLIGEDIELVSVNTLDLWRVKADRSQIEQVILNLAVNARDAMPRGGKLTIETSNVEFDNSYARAPVVLAPGRYVMLAVTDNGCGMDAETQAHIFEPFFTTKEKGKGTGLGLATVYGIVKQSGGYVWVYSEPGQGTTFKVYLPRVDEDVAPKELRPGPDPLPRGTETILLVEDEQGVRDLAKEYLEMSGYTVLVAGNGSTAVELVSQHAGPIDLIMTDVVMPGMSGSELAERISALRPGIRVVYMSGYTDQSIVHHGILSSDVVLLQKPFTLSTLAHKLREALVAKPQS
ncbi:MAG: PAS domain S-box protein [Candidatus Acidiferrales bacterium]